MKFQFSNKIFVNIAMRLNYLTPSSARRNPHLEIFLDIFNQKALDYRL